MGETRVDLLNLLEDLRDAYRGSLEETIFDRDPRQLARLGRIADRGRRRPSQNALLVPTTAPACCAGNSPASTTSPPAERRRGEGIGFAGVGIKLALLASEEVVTETWKGKTHVATRWRASRHRK